MKPLKIAMIVDHFNPQVHGSHEYHLTKELIAMGHKVTIITSDRNTRWGAVTRKDMKKRFPTGKSSYEGMPLVRLKAAVEIVNVPVIPGLYSFLMKNDFDIIHSHEYFVYTSYSAARAARSKGVHFIFTNSGYKRSDRFFWKHVYRLAENIIGKKVVSQADKIISLTKQGKDFLVEFGAKEERIEITPTGVNTEKFRPGIESVLKTKHNISGNVILCCARLIENKGQHVLIEAFRKIKVEVSDAKLVFVGKGEDEKKLKELANDIKDVFFLGAFGYEDMPSVYNGADVFCLPTVYEEPFGNVIVESAACGVPAVGSSVGGIKETIKEGFSGFHVKPDIPKVLAEKLILLLKDEALRKTMGKQARERAEKEYSWKIIAEKTSRIYEEMLR